MAISGTVHKNAINLNHTNIAGTVEFSLHKYRLCIRDGNGIHRNKGSMPNFFPCMKPKFLHLFITTLGVCLATRDTIVQ